MTDPPPFVDQGQERGDMPNISETSADETSSAFQQELDLSDPAIRRMVESNHRPEEMWTLAGLLLSVHCEQCWRSWPCPAVVALRALPKSEERDAPTTHERTP